MGISVVVVERNGHAVEVDLGKKITKSLLCATLRCTGIVQRGSWELDDGSDASVVCFCSKEQVALHSQYNPVKLPMPMTDDVVFGDYLYAKRKKGDHWLSFTTEDYEELMEEMGEGEEDEDEGEDEGEDDDDDEGEVEIEEVQDDKSDSLNERMALHGLVNK
tara:strand:- start:9835 stop:10320 length:486 start_codon:yes stop_codon:yes gene_type:complete